MSARTDKLWAIALSIDFPYCQQLKVAAEERMAKFDALPKELRDEANEVGLNRVLKRVGCVRRDGDA